MTTKLTKTQARILQWLEDAGPTTATNAAIGAFVNAHEITVARIVGTLEDAELIDVTRTRPGTVGASGRHIVVTPAGIEYLAGGN